MGPTAAGKTDLAAALVAEFPLEIVSVDAAMVFRGMDVGTAKPGSELLARAPHHLIDVIDPADSRTWIRMAIASHAYKPIGSGKRVPYVDPW